MRESQRLLEDARRMFKQAADATDADEVERLSDLGQKLLVRAEEAALREKSENGGKA
jgi:hypothetical protein